MTALCPLIDEELRGTYLGLSQKPVIDYLVDLGVTAVELLPVHFHFDEPHLADKSLTNYWGYSTLGFFAPDPRYAHGKSSDAAILEFRQMAEAFHQAGIEVILDVVFNHTCEGGTDGPTVSFRGFDNATYYRLDAKDRSRYFDYTGCGNTIDTRHPYVTSMIVDSLRYWVEYMGVDGFRFDLAPVLGRGRFDMDPHHGFMQIVAHDEVLSNVKLLAEPWDLSTYQLGHFPPQWLEWNGQYRDTVRSFWRNEHGIAAKLATRISGSSDIFGKQKGSPLAGVNFITCHDGFTLRDLVSYERKVNDANMEDGADGSNDNRSWNCGVEGETDSEEILTLRLKQQKNFLLTLFVSAGVPMLLGGDEVSRSQMGNNNGYCQDNEISWMPWSDKLGELDLRGFIKELTKIRSENPTFRRSIFFIGCSSESKECDISWWLPDASRIEEEHWRDDVRPFAVLYGKGVVTKDEDADVEGIDPQASRLLLCLNPTSRSVEFSLPPDHKNELWSARLSTSLNPVEISEHKVMLDANSAILLSSS
ncbi:UNVERIFIED_CONTAM: hypothetical protein GTU68_023981 [Idotea baltica]|nr:hypothetical protein [Idotea baltica]